VRAPLLALALSSSAALGCATTYHPEYHPETRYTFVQNVSYGDKNEPPACNLGQAEPCWRACFERSAGEACYLLGLMFETGHGLAKSHEDAARMTALARSLGYGPASIDLQVAAPYLDLWSRGGAAAPKPPRVSSVSSKGGLIVYGSVNGDIFLGK
jgi:hypothetical protein